MKIKIFIFSSLLFSSSSIFSAANSVDETTRPCVAVSVDYLDNDFGKIPGKTLDALIKLEMLATAGFGRNQRPSAQEKKRELSPLEEIYKKLSVTEKLSDEFFTILTVNDAEETASSSDEHIAPAYDASVPITDFKIIADILDRLSGLGDVPKSAQSSLIKMRGTVETAQEIFSRIELPKREIEDALKNCKPADLSSDNLQNDLMITLTVMLQNYITNMKIIIGEYIEKETHEKIALLETETPHLKANQILMISGEQIRQASSDTTTLTRDVDNPNKIVPGICGLHATIFSRIIMGDSFTQVKDKYPQSKYPIFFGSDVNTPALVAPMASKLMQKIFGKSSSPGILGPDLEKFSDAIYMRTRNFDVVLDEIERNLKQGKPIIALTFSSRESCGHLVVIIGYHKEARTIAFYNHARLSSVEICTTKYLEESMDHARTGMKILGNLYAVQVLASSILSPAYCLGFIPDLLYGTNYRELCLGALKEISAVDAEKSNFGRFNFFVWKTNQEN